MAMPMRTARLHALLASAALTFVPCTGLTQQWPAATEALWGQLVGYEIVGLATVTGFADEGRRGDDFEGCVRGRPILLDGGGLALRCAESTLMNFAMQPRAVLFANPRHVLMLVDGTLYRMER